MAKNGSSNGKNGKNGKTNGQWVGQKFKRKEDPRLIRGISHYTDDIWRDIPQRRSRIAADLQPGLRQRMHQRPGLHGAHDSKVRKLSAHLGKQSDGPGDVACR